MKKATKTALAFAAFAALATSASASERPRFGMMGGFERADADKSGDVTYEEFAAVFGERFKKADADANGELTLEEVAAGIQKMRAERMARRVIGRMDANDDGKLTIAEIESQQKKIFALADRNDDGKIVESEMKRRHKSGKRRGWFGGGD